MLSNFFLFDTFIIFKKLLEFQHYLNFQTLREIFLIRGENE